MNNLKKLKESVKKVFKYKQNRKYKTELRQELYKDNKKKIYCFGIPTHVNIGDQAIAFATRKFLTENFQEFTIIEISANNTYLAIPIIKSFIKKEDLITIHGGGNMGDLYLSEEKVRRKVIINFKNNRIISMPQSIFFTSSKKGQQELSKTVKIYSEAPNLQILAREKRSFEDMKKVFKTNEIHFIPDIVFSMDRLNFTFPRQGAITLIRNDIEASLSKENREALFKILKKNFEDINTSDTRLKEDAYITRELSDIILLSKWSEIARYKLAITDRLHGMIFGYITKTPTIVFDNSYKKVSETYFAFLKDCEYIVYIDKFSEESVQEAIEKLSNTTNYEFDLKKRFESLINLIKK